jgi:hypothetical protein
VEEDIVPDEEVVPEGTGDVLEEEVDVAAVPEVEAAPEEVEAAPEEKTVPFCGRCEGT